MTFKVYTGSDLQGVEYASGGIARDLEVNVSKVGLRNDSVMGSTIIFVCPRSGGPDLDGSEGWDGSQEERHIANVVSTHKFEVGKMEELSKSLDGEAGPMGETRFETADPKDPRRRGVFEKEVENDSEPLIARKSIDLNIDLLQLSSVPVPIEGGEDLIQHRSRCAKLYFLDALHVGQ